MSELNKVQLFGRVVKDAELKKAGNNVSVAQFSVANNHSYKNKENGEWVNEVDFFPIAIYGAYAEKRGLPKILLVIGTSMQTMFANEFVWRATHDGWKVIEIKDDAEHKVLQTIQEELEGANNAEYI